jgi:hypothetical protein
MTPKQLLHLGTRRVVYLKSGMRDGEQAFMLHGVDGASLIQRFNGTSRIAPAE